MSDQGHPKRISIKSRSYGGKGVTARFAIHAALRGFRRSSHCLPEISVVPQVKPTIAIVDDDASICRALKRLVRSLDMDAEAFTSAESYLDIAGGASSFHADCLILDVQLPGMSGLKLQSRLARTDLPIVFISAQDEAAEQALATAGAFLLKPFDDESLISALNVALSRNVFTN